MQPPMRSLFVLMLALAIPFWSLSRTSVTESRRLQEAARISDHCGYPQPTTTPEPARAKDTKPGVGMFSPIGLSAHLAGGLYDAACPVVDVRASVVRHDPVISVADVLIVAPAFPEANHAKVLAANDMPTDSRLDGSRPNWRTGSRYVGLTAAGSAATWLAQWANRQWRAQMETLESPSSFGLAAFPFANGDAEEGCVACDASTWWQGREALDALVNRLTGDGLVEWPTHDGESIRLFTHWSEQTGRQMGAAWEMYLSWSAGHGVRLFGTELGRLAGVAVRNSHRNGSAIVDDRVPGHAVGVIVEDVQDAAISLSSPTLNSTMPVMGWGHRIVGWGTEISRRQGQRALWGMAETLRGWSEVVRTASRKLAPSGDGEADYSAREPVAPQTF